jgi:hypothetical protein
MKEVVSMGFENRNDADTSYQISSTGPSIVHACGELFDDEFGALVRFILKKGGVTVRKALRSGIDATCLMVGEAPGETITLSMRVGGGIALIFT